MVPIITSILNIYRNLTSVPPKKKTRRITNFRGSKLLTHAPSFAISAPSIKPSPVPCCQSLRLGQLRRLSRQKDFSSLSLSSLAHSQVSMFWFCFSTADAATRPVSRRRFWPCFRVLKVYLEFDRSSSHGHAGLFSYIGEAKGWIDIWLTITVKVVKNGLCGPINNWTEMGLKVGTRLPEFSVLTSSGCGARSHATLRPPHSQALYVIYANEVHRGEG